MSLEILKKLNFYKILKITTVCAALSLALLIIFYSPETSATNYLGLPACSTIASPVHRVNCTDLIDLPLCDDLRDEGANPSSMVNCVEECRSIATDSDASKVRGRDYAVHNVHCMRFCDTLSGTENGFTQTLTPDFNCIPRKCHQLPAGTLATSINCAMSKCNLLTATELNNRRFTLNSAGAAFDSSAYDIEAVPAMPDPPNFCDGSGVKCYQFTQDKLPYAKIWPKNSMCQIHNCKPSPSTCAVTDDTLNISNNTSTLAGKTYTEDYVHYINSDQALTNNLLCNHVECPIITKRPYPCGGDGTTRNSACDAAGTDGGACVGGTCYLTIDCNSTTYSSEIECVSDRASTGSNISTSDTDVMNSWFYRPAPMDKATRVNKSNDQRVLLPMEPELCFTASQFKDNTYHSLWGRQVALFGYFHYSFGLDPSRSPGRCMSDWGSRGQGYLGLCGNEGLITKKVSEYTGYHAGYVVSDFTGDEIVHKLNVCLRFNNTARLYDIGSDSEVCGRRECGVTALFGSWSGQTCGGDSCKELTVLESNQKECQYRDDNDLFTNESRSKDCLAVMGSTGTLNGYLRLRAVKYNNRICTFLDVKGQLAYNGMFLDGTKKLSDGTCISGEKAADGSCAHAKDSNDSKTTADKWRALIRIPYIIDNQPSASINGYLDRDGQFFEAQECIKTELRAAPPRIYNLANQLNSPRLFMPPLYISASRTKRDSGVSPPSESDGSPGATDFNYPEIEITFGSEKKSLSLGLEYIGDELGSAADPKGTATLTSSGTERLDYTITAFIKKDLDSNNNPILCLYRKLFDENDAPITPMMVQCVKRSLPEIDNVNKKQGIYITREAIATNVNNSKINLRYVSDYGTNALNNSCTVDDTCSSVVTLQNPIAGSEVCSTNTENYKVCSKRDECTRLRIECLQNEIDLQASKVAGANTTSFINYRNYCNNTLLPSCAAKKGITIAAGTSVLDSDPFEMTGVNNSYGLFSEMCLTKGFERKLKKVLAYDLDGPILGKCQSSCAAGGNKKLGCSCIEYVEGSDIPNGMEARFETPREAGLCIDIPKTQLCTAIDYNTSPGESPDTEHVASSVEKLLASGYGSSGVHITHQRRTAGTTSGHAEFPVAVPGTSNIEGDCVGFWKDATDSVGVKQKPKRNCQYSSPATNPPTWSTVTTSCVRYTCNAIAAPDDGTGSLNNYPLTYSSGETGDNVGNSNGYANWPSHLQASDFMEAQAATSCIPGFKAMGATATNSDGAITGYTGGTLPQRYCGQIGTYYPPTATGKNPLATSGNPNPPNQCERITCPAINPTNPTTQTPGSAAYWAAWQEWTDSAGATYPSVKASRSKIFYAGESISTGTCNNTLGFFKAVNGNSPTRKCDYLGNWGPVIDPCVTTCDAVNTELAASSNNNSYAYWPAVVDVPISGSKTSSAGSCVSGYVRYPYAPRKTNSGVVIAGTTYTEPPVFTAALPIRTCQSVVTAGGSANVWTAANSSCINACPGSTTDPRITIGVTQHPTSAGQISVSWEEGTLLGNDQYQHACGGVGADYFTEGRANGCYLLKRHCNTNGKWDAPMPSCTARYDSGSVGGVIANARYEVIGVAKGYTNSLSALTATNNSLSKATGTCQPGYWPSDSVTNATNNTSTVGTAVPLRQCLFATGNNIDQTYWSLLNSDCKRIECPAITFSATTRTASTNVAATYANDSAANIKKDIGCNSQSILASGSTAPYITCQSDGTWSSLQDATNCKTGCTGNPYAGLTTGEIKLNDTGGGSGTWFASPLYTDDGSYIRDGEEITITAADSDGGQCEKAYYAARCVDGGWQNNAEWWEGNEGLNCYAWKYNWTSRSTIDSAVSIGWTWTCIKGDGTNSCDFIKIDGTAKSATRALR
jgi:hypothetical protein